MILLFLTLFLLLTSDAEATRYWADSAGSSGATCTDIDGTADPGSYGTVQRAIDCATANGGTNEVYIKPGTYTAAGSYISNPPSNTTIRGSDSTYANWPTLKPTSGAAANTAVIFSIEAAGRSNITVNYIKFDATSLSTKSACVDISPSSPNTATNIVVDGFKCLGTSGSSDTAAGVKISTTTTATVRNGEISGWSTADGQPGAHCMYWRGPNGLVEHIYCHDNDGLGIQFYSGGAGTAVNNIFRYNYIKNTSKSCVLAADSGNTIHHNVLVDCGSNGISMNGATTKAYNNTVYSVTSTGININHSSASAINNIAASNGTNVSNPGGGTSTTNSTSAACMIDPTNADFNLVESSACIDAGTSISGFSSGKFVGSLPDQGALEAPIRLSAVIEDADKDNYLITFSLTGQGVRDGVGLKTCTHTDFAIRDDGAGTTENSCTITGTSVLAIDLNADMTSGVADDAYTRGTLTDNVCIGDPNSTCLNAKVRTYSAAAATNNVGGSPSALESVHFRCLSWYADTTPSSDQWLRAEDASNSTLRCPIRAGGVAAVAVAITSTTAVGQAFEWHANRNGGGYSAMTNTCSSTTLCFANTNAPAMADGETIDAAILTDPNTDYDGGSVVGQQATQPTINFGTTATMNAIILVKTDAAATVGDAFCVQAAPAGGAVAGITQTQYPCFVVVAPASGF